MAINPRALVLIALCTVAGALLGSWLIGLGVGLAIVLAAEAVK